MFTGIVEATAQLLELQEAKVVVSRPKEFTDVRLGSSIAVNGCCLTISELQHDVMVFDLTAETLAKTTFSRLSRGSVVNLERAMLASARLDGHIVQGHIECIGEVVSWEEGELRVRIQKEFKDFALKKGSIAIDGTSLTIADVRDDVLLFAIIPYTSAHTVIQYYKPGTQVNMETDILGRYARNNS